MDNWLPSRNLVKKYLNSRRTINLCGYGQFARMHT